MDDKSVYSPPISDLTVEESGQSLNSIESMKATKTRRFFTYVLDMVFYYLLAVIIGIVLYLTVGEVRADEIIDSVPEFVLGYIIMLIYYIPQEALTGRTLAKLILGTRVVDEHGKDISALTALGRSFARLIPFEPFSFLGPTGRGWHDSLSSTYVIRVS